MPPVSELSRRGCRGRQPLLWAALAFAAGIFTGVHCWRPPIWWVVAGTIALAVTGLFLKRRPRVAGIAALSALFCVGALSIGLRAPKDPGRSVLALADGQEVNVTAHVLKDGLLRPAGFGGVRQVVDLETEELSVGDYNVPMRAGLRMSFYSKQPESESTASTSSLRILH